MAKGDMIVGVDIGTTKICTVIGEIGEKNEVEIVGVGSAPSRGIRKGVVIDLESTTHSIGQAVSEAELMAGVDVGSVYVGIAGGHIKGLNSHGVIAISSRRGDVTRSDVDRVIDAAKAVAIPPDREVIHILPQQYIIDSQNGIKDPIGLSGTRLEAEIYIVTGAVASAQNIVKAVNQAEFVVDDIVLAPLAASQAVLDEDEKELGVVLVDIGGGTTDIIVFVEGSVRHTEVITLGGNYVTHDISMGLRTPVAEAERIKIAHGSCLASSISGEETLEVPSVGERKARTLPKQVLAEIIQPRMEEIFELVNREIRRTGYEKQITTGVVLTGGASQLGSTRELAERIFDLPVRIGIPRGIKGLVDIVATPQYATGVGLVLYGANDRIAGKGVRFIGGNLFKDIFSRMKEWVGEMF
ncbi:MAG: cell division protein FtsA [bacterium]